MKTYLKQNAIVALFLALSICLEVKAISTSSKEIVLKNAQIDLKIENKNKNLSGPSGDQNQNDPKPILDLKKYFEYKPLDREKLLEGPKTGGGGHSCSLSIIAHTEALIEAIDHNPNFFSEAQLTELIRVMKTAKFSATERLFLNGEEKEAINYPFENRIELSRSFCEKMELVVRPHASGASAGLLLHEFLGLALIDDSYYGVTRVFLDSMRSRNLRKENFSQQKQATPEKAPVAAPEGSTHIQDLTFRAAQCAQQALSIADTLNRLYSGKHYSRLNIFIKNAQTSEWAERSNQSRIKVESYLISGIEKFKIHLAAENCDFINSERLPELDFVK